MSPELRVIAATPRHYDQFTSFHAQLGAGDHPPSAESWTASMMRESFFLELDGRFAAYGWGQVLSDSGYVRHVVVDAALRGRGLGRAVMREHARRFRAARCANWRLNVLVENAVAIALYHSLGMQREYATWVVRIEPRRIAELEAPREALVVREAAVSEDASIERAFEFPAGLLAPQRAKPRQRFVVVETRASGGIAAFAHFDPHHPGCWPFVAHDPSLARPMLDALAPDFPAGAPWIQLVIERDERLARALLDAGAMLHHQIEHMSGAIPAP